MTVGTSESLIAERITKRFGGAVALSDVSFEVRPGEIHAICGENGAGKSTLIKILSGQYPEGTYEGMVSLGGRRAHFKSVRDAQSIGIAVVHQELALIPALTVAENLFLPQFPRKRRFIDWSAMARQAVAEMQALQVDIPPDEIVGRLGVGQRQLVEIVRALARKPRFLILDEPTAALSATESACLFDVLRRLRGLGVACIYISHRLEELQALADRVTVLRDGHTVTTLDADQLDTRTIVRQMVGRELTDVYPAASRSVSNEVLLDVQQLSVLEPRGSRVRLAEISLQVHAGEILGLGGLLGAGRSELLMHLYGMWGRRVAGKVSLGGISYEAPSPRESLRRGLMLATEDRQHFGLAAHESIEHNLTLSSLDSVTRGGWIDRVGEYRRAAGISERLRIAHRSLEQPVRDLSGGNQQKVVLGRGLLTEPRVVLLDEPTRGIDVGAKREIYREIRQLVAERKAVLLVSSELPELMGLSDRIIMIRDGRIGGQFDRRPFRAEELMLAATSQRAGGKPSGAT